MNRIASGAAALAGIAATALAATWPAPQADAAATGSTRPAAAVYVLLDTDWSEADGPYLAFQQAAVAYVRSLPGYVRVGLITFGDQVYRDLPLRTSRRTVLAEIGAMPKEGATSNALPQALSAAATALRTLGPLVQKRLVIFSNSETSNQTGPQPPNPGVRSNVVAVFRDSDDSPATLYRLASETGGHFLLFTNRAPAARRSLGTTTAAIPAIGSPSVLAAAAAAWSLEFPPWVPAPVASRAITPIPKSVSAAWMLPGVLAAFFFGLMLLALLIMTSLNKQARERRLTGLLDSYGPRHSPRPGKRRGTGTVGATASSALVLSAGRNAKAAAAPPEQPERPERKPVLGVAVSGMAQVLDSSNTGHALGRRLELAGISRPPAEWALIGSGICAVLAIAIGALTASIWVGLAAGLIIGGISMRLILSLTISRRRAAFADQLPDILQRIGGSLRSGFSLAQALNSVVRENMQPAAAEFGRALAEVRIGQDLELALSDVAERMDSDDLRWTVMALRIHRDVGGNLAEVLDSTATTMRDRAAMRRHVRALSAEGRLSAYILIALPIVIGIWLFMTDRAYLRPLFTTGIGIGMICGAVVLIVIGSYWMSKVIKVEV